MPATKVSKTNESEKLQLARAINNITKSREAFNSAVESFNALEQEHLKDLDLRIEEKHQELKDAEESLSQKRKRGEIDCENDLAEHRRTAAVDFLEATREVPVEAAVLEKLRADLARAQTEFDSAVAQAHSEEKAKGQSQLNAALRQQELTNKAEVATLQAQLDQKEREIEVLHETIRNLRQEVSEQRQLTKDVAASAASNSAPVYVKGGRD